MGNLGRWDLVRQVVVVIGAVLQVVAPVIATALVNVSVGEVSEANSTLVVPADYAFAVWGPIFLLSFAFAVYQALPAKREDPLLRRVGWWIGGAFLLNGVWEILFPASRFLLAEVVFLGVFACLFVAYRRLVSFSGERALSGPECWLVALPLGLLFGWVTVANFVGVATTLVGVGLLGGGIGEALLGAALLLLGGLCASALILYGKIGPLQGYVAYAGAVVWGLGGVVVNQYDASLLTTGTALISAALVALVLFGALREVLSRRRAGRNTWPETA